MIFIESKQHELNMYLLLENTVATFLGHKNPRSVFPNFQDQTTRIFIYEVLNPSEDGINIHRQPCEFWCYRQEQKGTQHMIGWMEFVTF